MSMIERVARVIYDELEGPVSNQDYVRQTQQWERSQKLARAAIEAMREPTIEMTQAACDATFGPDPLSPEAAHSIGYRAMIETALNGE